MAKAQKRIKQLAYSTCQGCALRVCAQYDPLEYAFKDNWAKQLGSLIHRLHIAQNPYCKNQEFEIIFNQKGSSFIYKDPQIIKNNSVIADREENKLITWLKSKNNETNCFF